ncbi:MAG: hypothetical protein Kow0037_06730 [Calditrichia bacterium]
MGYYPKKFPTHDGTIPELNFSSLGMGIFQNFTLNLAALWAIYQNPDPGRVGDKWVIGLGGGRLKLQTVNAEKNLWVPAFSLGYWLNDRVLLQQSFSTSMFSVGDGGPGYRDARMVITSNQLGIRYLFFSHPAISYYVELWGGLVISNHIDPVEEGALSFGRIDKKRWITGISIGPMIRVSRSLQLDLAFGSALGSQWKNITNITDVDSFGLQAGLVYNFIR